MTFVVHSAVINMKWHSSIHLTLHSMKVPFLILCLLSVLTLSLCLLGMGGTAYNLLLNFLKVCIEV